MKKLVIAKENIQLAQDNADMQYHKNIQIAIKQR
jgi:hypothetical protein